MGRLAASVLRAAVLLAPGLLRADFDAPQWRFRKPVNVPAAGLCALAIDREVFAASGTALADLRLIAGGAEVPWVLGLTENRSVIAAAAPSRTEERESRATVLDIDVGSPNVPYDRVRIESPEAYFYRDAEVEVSAARKQWEKVAWNSLYRLPAGETVAIAFPERRERFVRLRLFNGDDRPIAVAKLDVEGFGRVLRFRAQAPGVYWLYYGNPAARAPVYDLARVLAQQPPDPGIPVTAGVRQESPEYRPPAPPQKPWTERYPALLYITLAGAVAGLAYILLRFRHAVSK